MTAKQLTLKQAEKQMEDNQDDYRAYVKAQGERKAASNKKEQDAAQKTMDKLRAGYTAYRNAYRAFTAQGGTKRKPAAEKPKAAKKSNGKKNGNGKKDSPAVAEPNEPEVAS